MAVLNAHTERVDETQTGSGRTAHRQLFFDAYAMTASTIASAVAGLVALVVSSHTFSTEAVGNATAMISAMALLGGIASLDLPHAFHRFLPGSGRSAVRLVLLGYAAVITIALPLSALYVAIFGESLFGVDRVDAVFWFSASVAVWSIFALQDHVLMGLGSAVVVPIENTLFGVGRIVLLFLLVGGSGLTIFVSWMIPTAVLLVVISVLIAVRVLPRHVQRSERASTSTSWDVPTVIRFVAGSYVGALTGIVTTNLLPLLVLAELGEAQAGFFYIAWTVASTVTLIAANFGASLVVQGATNPAHVRSMLIGVLKKQSLLMYPGLVFLAFFSTPILRLIFGAEYGAAGPMLQLLSIGLLFRLIWSLYLPIARLHGHIKAMLVTQVLSAVFNLVCMYAGLKMDGLTGIGWGFLVSNVITMIALLPALRSAFVQPPSPSLRAVESGEVVDAAVVGESPATTSPPRHRRPSAARLVLSSLAEDFRMGWYGLWSNRLAASIFMPRVGRYMIYRMLGMEVETPNIFNGAQFAGRKLKIGKGTFVNTNVHFENVALVTIGRDCQIGMEALFVTSHHEMHEGGVSRDVTPLPIVVGDGCWIGARAMILPGVTIGENCVIAAGAVVTKDCEPGGVYAGTPARRIRDLTNSRSGSGSRHYLPKTAPGSAVGA